MRVEITISPAMAERGKLMTNADSADLPGASGSLDRLGTTNAPGSGDPSWRGSWRLSDCRPAAPELPATVLSTIKAGATLDPLRSPRTLWLSWHVARLRAPHLGRLVRHRPGQCCPRARAEAAALASHRAVPTFGSITDSTLDPLPHRSGRKSLRFGKGCGEIIPPNGRFMRSVRCCNALCHQTQTSPRQFHFGRRPKMQPWNATPVIGRRRIPVRATRSCVWLCARRDPSGCPPTSPQTMPTRGVPLLPP